MAIEKNILLHIMEWNNLVHSFLGKRSLFSTFEPTANLQQPFTRDGRGSCPIILHNIIYGIYLLSYQIFFKLEVSIILVFLIP